MGVTQPVDQVRGTRSHRSLAVVAGLTVLACSSVFVASQAGAISRGISTTIVVLGMGVVCRVAWNLFSRSASSAERARLSMVVSSVGLAIAALTALAALPRVTKGAGLEIFSLDTLAQCWTLIILFAAAGPARTLQWRALLGGALFGFLGIMALARMIGRPVVVSLGNRSLFAMAIWVPVTEEIVKLLPLVVLLILARRRPGARGSVLDLVLLTGMASAGFAVSENASYGRGGFSLVSSWVSWLSPAALKGSAYGWEVVQTGHLVHSALIALAVGVAVFHRLSLPAFISRVWVLPVAAALAVLLEHCAQNAIITGGLNQYVGEGCLILTLGGRLCALLLILGLGLVVYFEWRLFAPLPNLKTWFWLSDKEASRRTRVMALATRACARQTDREPA